MPALTIDVGRIARTAMSRARRRLAPTVVAVLAAATSAGAMTYLLGTTYASDSKLLGQLESPEGRGIVVQAQTGSTVFDADTVGWIAELPGVSSLVALTSVLPARNQVLSSASQTVGFFKAWTVKGSDSAIRVVAGREPRGNEEVLASASAATRLQMLDSSGELLIRPGESLPIVGLYSLRQDGPLERFLEQATVALQSGRPTNPGVLVIVATSAADVIPAAAAIRAILPQRTSDFTIEFSQEAGDLAQLVAGGRQSAARTSAIAIAVTGAFIQGLVAAFGALSHRRETARSRALGTTRLVIALTLCFEVAVVVAAGASIGGVVAGLGVRLASDVSTPVIALAALSLVFGVCVSLLATIPVALAVAYQDPALVLRVP